MNLTNNMTPDKNLFGNALGELLASTKEIFSRKILGRMLGVSESAISQWVSGKIFPEGEKLRSLVTIYQGLALNKDQKEKFSKLKAVLEYALSNLWDKAPETFRTYYASDYVLKDMQSDAFTSISVFYYDLKVEMYHQFQRQAEVLKEELTHLLSKSKSCSKISAGESKLATFKTLRKTWQEAKCVNEMSYFTDTVKQAHSSFNEELKMTLRYLMDNYRPSDENIEATKSTIQAVGIAYGMQRSYQAEIACDYPGTVKWPTLTRHPDLDCNCFIVSKSEKDKPFNLLNKVINEMPVTGNEYWVETFDSIWKILAGSSRYSLLIDWRSRGVPTFLQKDSFFPFKPVPWNNVDAPGDILMQLRIHLECFFEKYATWKFGSHSHIKIAGNYLPPGTGNEIDHSSDGSDLNSDGWCFRRTNSFDKRVDMTTGGIKSKK